MAVPYDHGPWWRLSRYEIRDGYIRPAANATLKPYDPWRDEEGRSRNGKPFNEFKDLLELARYNPPLAHLPPRLTPQGEALVLHWCNQNGLLGILLHEVESVRLWPRWQHTPRAIATNDGALVAVAKEYVRHAAGWNEIESFELSRLSSVASDAALLGQPLEDLPERWRPRVLRRALQQDQAKHEESLSDRWGVFFPGVPREEVERYPFPEPLSEQFWKLYAEPVTEFIRVANIFGECLTLLSTNRPGIEKEPAAGQLVFRGHDLLQRLLEPIRTTLVPLSGGRFREYRIHPNLLASLAMMLVHDLSDTWIRLCARCRKPFPTKHKNALYCSGKCKRAAQMKRYRNPPNP